MDLRKRIKERGIKQSWIAEKIGISRSLLHHYLTGVASMPTKVEEEIKLLIS